MIDSQLQKRFLAGMMSTGLGTLTTIILGLVNILLAARHVSRAELGIYILILAVVSCAELMSDLGINIATIKIIACSTAADRVTIIDTVVIYKLAVTMALAGFSAVYLTTMGSADYLAAVVSNLACLALLLVLESLNTTIGAVLQGVQAFRRMAAGKVIVSTVNCVTLFVLVAVYRFGLTGLICARVLALACAILYQALQLSGHSRLRFDKAVFLQVIGFGYPLGLNNILTFVFLKLDTLLIGYLLNPVSVALYGIAAKIPDASRQMFEAFRSVFFPNMAELFAEDRKDAAEDVLNNSLRLVSFLTVLVSLGVYLFQEQIVVLLFSENYRESAPVLAVLMLALSIGLIGNLIGTSLVAAGQSRLPVVINLCDTVATVTANLILIPLLGIIGAAYAAVLSRIITNPLNVYFLKRNGVTIELANYLKPLTIYAVCIVLHKSLASSAPLTGVLILAVYVALCSLSAVVSASDVSCMCKAIGLRADQETS